MGEENGTNWYSEEQATFGDRLTAAREAAGLTQKELASRIGVKLETLRAWEDDLKEPRANRLQMMSGILGVSLQWMLSGQGEGLGHPDQAELSPDVSALFAELRTLRAQMASSVERLGQLEKRLRAAVKDNV